MVGFAQGLAQTVKVFSLGDKVYLTPDQRIAKFFALVRAGGEGGGGLARYMDAGGGTAYLYCLTDGENCKIGWAVDPHKRLRQLQIGNAKSLRIVAKLKCKNTAQAMMRERHLHRKYRKHKVRGEWFSMIVAEKPFGAYS